MRTHERIWNAVKRIPRGKVATYGQIATFSGLDGLPRLVGYALHALPVKSNVPWHRVINATGRISLKGPVARKQKALLQKEGVRFEVSGKINLKKYRWQPKQK